MSTGIRYEQGDILLVSFPFSNLRAVKQRPVIVLSREETGDDIIVCAVTSNLSDTRHGILIDSNNLRDGSLAVLSMIKVDKIFTIEKTIVRRRIGALDEETMDSVRKEFLGLV